MALNIKNDETYNLVQKLASLTGESMTTAITIAVQERIDRLQAKETPSLSERLLAIGKDTAARIPESYRSIDHGELLYDENGLPK